LVLGPIAILLAIIISVGVWCLRGNLVAPGSNIPEAIIVGLEGRVEIRRQVDDRVQIAAFGLELFNEDAVLTYEAGAVYVLCENGLLFNVGSNQTLLVRCQENGDNRAVGRLDPRVGANLIQTNQAITLTLAPANTRAARTDIGQIPTLIEPRNTAITTSHPLWRWEGVNSAELYHLVIINSQAGQAWEAETTTTELIYPDNAPPLVPQLTYLTQLVPTGAASQSDESFFFLLDEPSRNEVAETEAAIHALSLNPTTASFLLAELYRQHGLYSAAIAQLESISAVEAKPGLY